MLERITFINHINEKIDFGKNGIYANYNDLRDYSWNFTEQNNRISKFDRGVVTKTIPLVIMCKSETEGLLLKNRLFEIAEKDVLSLKHGKLIINGYYLKCYVTGSKKDNYLVNKGYLETTITITTDIPFWIKETVTTFRTNAVPKGKNLDYNFDFPFDFTSEMKNKTLVNPGFVASNFRIIFYGPVINPTIHISGHTYQVNCEVSDNEYLTIDSLTKKIILTKYNGEEVNCFNNRYRQSYVFEKIPSGGNIVTSNGTFGFDVILIEERSEPKWI